MDKLIKNMEHCKVLDMENLVEYQDGTVVSRTISQGRNLSVTLFAFDKGEEISAHSAPGDALVYILDGEAEVKVGNEKYNLKKGQTIVMPKEISHALYAKERFKMFLLVVFNLG